MQNWQSKEKRRVAMKNFSDYNINAPVGSGQWYTLCPECSHLRQMKNQKKKCLSVNLSEGTWNCHNCSWAGKLGFTDDEKKQWVESHKKMKPIPRNFKGIELKTPTKGIYKWFKEKRGIGQETLDMLKVSWKKVYIPAKETKVNAIAFPYYQDYDIVGVKYRTVDKEFTQEKGGKKTVYNFDNLLNANEIYCVEGEMDVLSLVECGYRTACSVGAAPSLKTKTFESYLEPITDAQNIFNKAQKIYICMDKDEVGIKWEEVIIEHIGKEKCYQVLYPSDCKDINDVLIKYGKEKVKECIKNAKAYPISGVNGFEDITENIYDFVSGKIQKTEKTSTGWKEFDEITMLPKASITIITGSPGAGKSLFVNNLIINTIQNWNWLVFSPEHNHLKHWEKLTRALLDKCYDPQKGITKYQADFSIDAFKHRLKHITVDEHQLTLEDILRKAKSFHYQYKLDALVIDPFNFVKINGKKDMLTHINEYLITCKHFARAFGVNVITVAHPTKLERLTESVANENEQEIANYRVAQPYDVSGSKDWFAIADVIYSVWRNLKPEKKDFIKVYALKCRDEEIGGEGVLNFTLNRSTGRLYPKVFDNYSKYAEPKYNTNYYN
jgi:twinkle protein